MLSKIKFLLFLGASALNQRGQCGDYSPRGTDRHKKWSSKKVKDTENNDASRRTRTQC